MIQDNNKNLLTKEEIGGLIQMVDYVINKRVNNVASDLSYLELISLKNNLRKLKTKKVKEDVD